MKPWERYQSEAPGPWTRYAAPTVEEQPMGAADVPALENFAAGIGKVLPDAHLALRKLGSKVGIGDEGAIQAEMDAVAKRDKPLMDTKAGTAGNIAGTLATAVIPGANTVKGSAMLGSAIGALQHTTADESILKNALIGGGAGVVGKVAGDKIAGAVSSAVANRATKAAQAEAQNAVRDAALKAAQEAGYVVPPTMVNPTLKNTAMESVAGKIGVEQVASVKNQAVTDSLARKFLGLNDTAVLTDDALAAMRKSEGQAYQAVKDFGQQVRLKLKADQQFAKDIAAVGDEIAEARKAFPSIFKNADIDALKVDLTKGAWSPSDIMEAVKKLRRDSTVNFKAFDNPEKLGLARAQRQAAEALDGLLERGLSASGAEDLATAYQAARVNIAKIHDVEAALSNGHVDLRVLAKMADKLTGELKVAADFASNFPKVVQNPAKIGSPGVHAARAGIGGAVGYSIDGLGGMGLGTVAAVAGPWAARNMLLSGVGQRMTARPQYGNALSDYLASKGVPLGRRLAGPVGADAALLYGSE